MKIGIDPLGDAHPTPDWFSWTVSQQDFVCFRDIVCNSILRFPFSHQAQKLGMQSCWTLLARYTLAIWVRLTELTRLNDAGYRADVTPRFPLMEALRQASSPSTPTFLFCLKSPQSTTVERLYGSGLGRAYEERHRMQRLVSFTTTKDRLNHPQKYSFNSSDFLRKLVEQEPAGVTKTRSARWFRNTRPAPRASNAMLGLDIVDTILGNLCPSDAQRLEFLRLHLGGVFQETVDAAAIHITRLLRRKDLPLHLSTGTGGNPWTAMLKASVAARGGWVAGHDHSIGLGFSANPKVQAMVESFNSSEYVVPTARRADAYFRGVQLAHIPPQVARVSELDRPLFGARAYKVNSRPSSQHDTKILYLATRYWGEQTTLYYTWNDAQYFQRQSAILSSLHSLSSQVLLRPHPECPIGVHPSFSAFGGYCNPDSLEEQINWADVLVFDWFRTSAMGIALASRAPIVLVDFDSVDWWPPAMHALKKRISIVEPQARDGEELISSDAFREAFEEAQGRRDDTFMLEYIG